MERGAIEDVYRTLESSKELFLEDFPMVGATTLVVNQVVQGSSLGNKDNKLVGSHVVNRLGFKQVSKPQYFSSK